MLVYHATRIVAYTLLGVASGLGAALVLRTSLQSMAPYLGVILGAIMLVYALLELGRVVRAMRAGRVFRPMLGHRQGSRPRGVSTWLLGSPLPKPVTLGLATALLPCGFLYAALAQAALLGHPFYSGAAMGIFAIATGPALAGGGVLLGFLGGRFPKLQPLAVALVLVAASATIFARALMQPHIHDATHDHHSHVHAHH